MKKLLLISAAVITLASTANAGTSKMKCEGWNKVLNELITINLTVSFHKNNVTAIKIKKSGTLGLPHKGYNINNTKDGVYFVTKGILGNTKLFLGNNGILETDTGNVYQCRHCLLYTSPSPRD